MPDFEEQHRRNIQALAKQLEKQYLAFAKQVSTIANDPKAKFQKSFKFVNNKAIQEKVDKLTGEFNTKILETISAGIVSGWGLANTKNDALVRATIKSAQALKIADGLNDRNLSALQSFINRKVDGLGLSDRVWKIGEQFRDEMEMHLQLGILNGDSANVVSRRVRQYLNEPYKLFRRVRDDQGKLVLSNAAKQYHPGQGVYRSSYKNARRTAATETNMAYRKSDHERWMKNPAVVGFEIKLSAQHPRPDICDDCKGKYPKSFVFSGWHPHCFCYTVPIMLSDDEFDKYLDSILEEKEYDPRQSENFVDDTPEGFKKWVDQNKERVTKMKNPPYWVKDNFKDGKISEGLAAISPVKTVKAVKAVKAVEATKAVDIFQQRMPYNVKRLEDELGIKKGAEMSFEDANELRGNVNYNTGDIGYKVNCQSCVVVNELRRRGFDVTAFPNTKRPGNIPYAVSKRTEMAWIDPLTNDIPEKLRVARGLRSVSKITHELSLAMSEVGRYNINFVWKSAKTGHIISVEKLSNGTYQFYDPQNGLRVSWADLVKRINVTKYGVGVLRVDNKLINTDIIKGIAYKAQ